MNGFLMSRLMSVALPGLPYHLLRLLVVRVDNEHGVNRVHVVDDLAGDVGVRQQAVLILVEVRAAQLLNERIIGEGRETALVVVVEPRALREDNVLNARRINEDDVALGVDELLRVHSRFVVGLLRVAQVGQKGRLAGLDGADHEHVAETDQVSHAAQGKRRVKGSWGSWRKRVGRRGWAGRVGERTRVGSEATYLVRRRMRTQIQKA